MHDDDEFPRRRCARRSASPRGSGVDDESGTRFAPRLLYVRRSSTTRRGTSALGERLKELDASAGRRAEPAVLPRGAAGLVRAIVEQLRRAGWRATRPRRAVGRASSSRSRSVTTWRRAKQLNERRAPAVRRAPDLPHRPLPRARRPCRTSSSSASRNAIFEPLWNRQLHRPCADHRRRDGRRRAARQVLRGGRRRCATCSRTICCSCSRWSRWSRRSQLRRADAVRDEKVKVLRSIRPSRRRRCRTTRCAAQYARRPSTGSRVRATARSRTSRRDSLTPTYAALRLTIDNWRWDGVPFYLRSGKRLAKRVSEIAIQFRRRRT